MPSYGWMGSHKDRLRGCSNLLWIETLAPSSTFEVPDPELSKTPAPKRSLSLSENVPRSQIHIMNLCHYPLIPSPKPYPEALSPLTQTLELKIFDQTMSPEIPHLERSSCRRLSLGF